MSVSSTQGHPVNPPKVKPICSHRTCLERVHCRGLCQRHYLRWAYHHLPGRKESVTANTARWKKRRGGYHSPNHAENTRRYRLRKKGLLPPAEKKAIPEARTVRRKG